MHLRYLQTEYSPSASTSGSDEMFFRRKTTKLQYSEDKGKTWTDIPTDFEYKEI
jgi:hypothetical protein